MLRTIPSQTLKRCASRAFSNSARSHYDVVIAGGGVMGASTAYHIASTSNLSVAVIERDTTYKHASAMLSCGGIRYQFSQKENVLMSMYGMEFLRDMPTRLAIDDKTEVPDVQFHEGGYLVTADDESEKFLKEDYDMQKSLGAHVAYMTPSELQETFPWMSQEGLSAGVLGLKNEGWFDPWSLLSAMRKKSVSLGVDFINGDVQGFDLDASNYIQQVRVATPAGEIQLAVDNVVNAAGAWCGKLMEACGIHDYPVKPRKRSVFSFHCPHLEVWSGKTPTPLFVEPSGVYFRPDSSPGQFMCGWSPLPEDDVDGESNDDLNYPEHHYFEDMIWPTIAQRVPAFEEIKMIGAWAGFYDFNTYDQNAIIDIHPELPNMYLINGFSGHGLQQSPAAGRAIAELLTHGEFQTIDLSCFQYKRVLEQSGTKERGIV